MILTLLLLRALLTIWSRHVHQIWLILTVGVLLLLLWHEGVVWLRLLLLTLHRATILLDLSMRLRLLQGLTSWRLAELLMSDLLWHLLLLLVPTDMLLRHALLLTLGWIWAYIHAHRPVLHWLDLSLGQYILLLITPRSIGVYRLARLQICDTLAILNLILHARVALLWRILLLLHLHLILGCFLCLLIGGGRARTFSRLLQRIGAWRFVLDDLRDYHLEEGGQLITFPLLLLKLVEKAGECFRPALVHLDHLGLDV